MKRKLDLHFLLFTLYLLLFFLTPLLMTPFTDEIFEFPKMVFVYGITIVVIFLYVLKILLTRKLTICKNPLYLPLIFIATSSLLSTLFSLHDSTSFYGYYTRFNGSFLSIVAYLILTLIYINEFNVAETKKILQTLLLSAMFVSIYGILQRLGIDRNYWVEHSWERVFSTLGQPNWLASFLVMLIPISLIMIVKQFPAQSWSLPRRRAGASGGSHLTIESFRRFYRQPGKILYSFITFIMTIAMIFCLIFTKSVSGYLALFVTLLTLLLYYLTTLPRHVRKITIWIGVMIFFSLIITILLYPHLLSPLYNLFWEKETNQIRLIVWQGTLKLIEAKPIFGWGLETFPFSFLPFRPEALNYTTEWNFLFNKPHNEFLEILSESGFTGLLVFFFFIIKPFLTLRKLWSQVKNRSEIIGLATGFLGLLITLIFGFQVVVTNLLFFLFPAFMITLTDIKFPVKTISFKLSKISRIFLFLLCFFFISYFLFLNSKLFLANVFYSQGSLTSLKKAVQIVPFENTYRRQLAYAYALNQSDNSFYQTLSESEITKVLQDNPYNQLNLQAAIKTYTELAMDQSDFLDKALEVTQRQTELVPTDPETWYSYGLILSATGKKDEAQHAFTKAVELKNDYGKATEMLNSF